MILQLTNDFHSSAARVRVRWGADGTCKLSPSQIRRARQSLCGVNDCTCCDDLGRRGRQVDDFEVVSALDDGGYVIARLSTGKQDETEGAGS